MRQFIFIFGLVLSMMAIQGCGGGGEGTTPTDRNDTDGGNNPDDENPSIDEPIGGESGAYKYNRITIAGSSITDGKGYLGENSYLGEVEKYLREEVATTIIPTEGTLINDPMSYKGALYKFTGEGTEIRGTIKGDKISIAFAKERGNAGATVEMIIDGVSKGTFSTKGETVRNGSTYIEGDGTKHSFDLGHAHTFNHNAPGTGSIYDEACGTFTFDRDWTIIRKIVGKKVHHFIVFKVAPDNNFNVTYDYAENIKSVKSSVSNVEQSIESSLESPCGDKYNRDPMGSFDPMKGTGTLDFRQTDKRAVKTWELDSYKDHNFTLRIKDGGSEEFILNFITNHMYYFQNAGIGGARAQDLDPTTPSEGGHPNPRTTEQIIAFKPDLFILESSTNDAKFSPSTNEWILSNATDFTISTSNQIRLATSANVRVGDVVVMGTYNGDIRNIAVGIVSQNSNSNIITLTKDVPTNVDRKCVIKRISKWENNVKRVISQVTGGINHDVKVGIATSGVPNLNERRLMGYREKGKIMATENSWMFFDFFEKTLGKPWSGDNTHPNTPGIKLFGEEITDVLKDQ